MAKRKQPNWDKIKNEYITTSTSYRKLCKKYNIPINTLEHRARTEKWVQERKQYQGNLAAKIQEECIKTDSEQIIELKNKERAIINTAIDGIYGKLVNKNGAFRTRLKPSDIKHLVISLKELQAMAYKSFGIADKLDVQGKITILIDEDDREL